MLAVKILLILIPALPLAAAVLTAALGPWLLRERSHWPTVVAVALSCAASMLLLLQVDRAGSRPAQSGEGPEIGYEEIVPLWTWAVVDDAYTLEDHAPGRPGGTARDFRISVTLRADALTAVMLATVTLISLLVAVYSIGYMQGDPGYWRFFAYIALFVFSMTMLVSVSNFVLLYVFWEAVGLCSYLLIGFWYRRPEAAAAGKKAFLVNRVGDFGFALGVFLLWTTYGTLNFHDWPAGGPAQVHGILGEFALSHPHEFYVGGGLGTAICLLLLLGACGKSAQFPLHVWLPDAMEGPTPVSALIHAATMVTAGVYMIARCSPLFLASPDAQRITAAVGAVTALLAALIAITQTDLKRILAYSTISQLGYMFMALGAATLLGVTAAMFHLFTHAFFKALLFLGAGSVMHAMGGVIDIRRFGGLRRIMPITHWTFLAGCLALAGIAPLSGFWSKDTVLVALGQQAANTGLPGSARTFYLALLVAALVAAGLTAFYTFRAYCRTFWGKLKLPPEAGHHAHESPGSMSLPLLVLAVGAIGVGGYYELTHDFADFLHEAPVINYIEREQIKPKPVAEGELTVEAISHWSVFIYTHMVGLAGIGLAVLFYTGARERLIVGLTRTLDLAGLYRLSHRRFFLDEIYDLLIVRPLRALARLVGWIDRVAIDGLVDVCGAVPVALGAVLRPLQNGLVQFYALAMVLGLLVLIATLLW